MRFYELLCVVPDNVEIEVTEKGYHSVRTTALNLKRGSAISPYNYLHVDKVSVGSISEQEAHFTGNATAYLTVLISRE